MKNGEEAEAIAELRKVLEEKPDHVRATYLIGLALAGLGRDAEAIRYARKGLELNPDYLHCHRLLGATLSRQGKYAEAIGHLETVLKARPQELVGASTLAWILATCPDATYRNGPRAVKLAERVCLTTRHSMPAMLDSLAAPYAEVGRFSMAASTARRALAILRRQPKVATQDLESRLKLYEAGKAYRQPAPAP